MTQEDIIRMAHEADGILLSDSEIFGLGFEFEIYQLERFAALVAAAERESCAKVCESYLSESPHSWGGTTMAAAIRARGQA